MVFRLVIYYVFIIKYKLSASVSTIYVFYYFWHKIVNVFYNLEKFAIRVFSLRKYVNFYFCVHKRLELGSNISWVTHSILRHPLIKKIHFQAYCRSSKCYMYEEKTNYLFGIKISVHQKHETVITFIQEI